ncbi:hypothetical protein [Granulicella sibirica]|uniref:Uncharacterized protein n=1 Tax=Granulicella sibirica TaxID=2479048 RepID=A0A4Q0STU8_9BACT|nr:hypothetical protein [Granulicella sibirica]RXH54443.1 hypothetical protein GRAN_4739 [Granulicella sibirica]
MAHKAISREDPIVQVFYPCEAGTRLLEDFAAARPQDYTFLEPKDFSDLRSSAFAGISEWDAFADHVQECALCGED